MGLGVVLALQFLEIPFSVELHHVMHALRVFPHKPRHRLLITLPDVVPLSITCWSMT